MKCRSRPASGKMFAVNRTDASPIDNVVRFGQACVDIERTFT
jgi:hypothetical protein